MPRNRNAVRAAVLSALLLWPLASAPVLAKVTLQYVFGDNMVLQQGMPVPVWGWASPGETVKVRLASTEASTTADAKGEWKVSLPPLRAGGPHELIVRGRNTIRLKNVLVGEVWICAGQSNMAMALAAIEGGDDEVASANHPQIRLCKVGRRPLGQPYRRVGSTWHPCTPQSVERFSAIAYLFGRELHKALGVPIGVLNCAMGSTQIEAWTPAEGFENSPALREISESVTRANAEYRRTLPSRLYQLEQWMGKARAALESGDPIPVKAIWPSHPLSHYRQPTSVYNGMIYPLIPFAFRGALWYQGENNWGDGMLYHQKMKALVESWRKVWVQGDFPFYFVQLAPHRYAQGQFPYRLPELWEAQTASLSIPNTGMVVINDIVTDPRDFHPGRKKEVAERLALWALANTYDRDDVVFSGPLYKSKSLEGDKIRIRFDHVGGGLASRDDRPLTWFEIAGADGNFVKAQARISSDSVVVWSPAIPEPVAVRFAWHETARPNLINREGLPGSPFRTDRR